MDGTVKIICKTFNTTSKAEQFQNKLYSQFDGVKLIRFPRFAQAGIYVWEVVYSVEQY